MTREKDYKILETQFVQRAFDGRWERVCKVLDTENSYSYKNEAGVNITFTPEKWITFGVYDAMMEIV